MGAHRNYMVGCINISDFLCKQRGINNVVGISIKPIDLDKVCGLEISQCVAQLPNNRIACRSLRFREFNGNSQSKSYSDFKITCKIAANANVCLRTCSNKRAIRSYLKFTEDVDAFYA